MNLNPNDSKAFFAAKLEQLEQLGGVSLRCLRQGGRLVGLCQGWSAAHGPRLWILEATGGDGLSCATSLRYTYIFACFAIPAELALDSGQSPSKHMISYSNGRCCHQEHMLVRFGNFALRLTLHKKWNGKKHLHFYAEVVAPAAEFVHSCS